jgi:drug/metabolite transporter (DMT)-like permease
MTRMGGVPGMLSLSASALALSIGCGLGFAASDYCRKAVPAACPAMVLMLYFVAGQAPVLAAWLLWTGEYRLTAAYWAPGLADVGCGLAGNLLFIAAVRRSPLSLMVPVLALVPVIAAAGSAVALGEIPTPRQGLGGLLIVAGLAILFVPAGGSQGLLRGLAREPGLPLMLLTAACWSATAVLDKLAIAAASVPVHGLLQIAILSGVALTWILAREGPRALALVPGAATPIAGAAVAAGLGYLFQLAAYMATMVALVELIKRLTGVISALVVGRIMFGEPLGPAKLTGIAVVAAGLPLVILF